MTEFLLIRHAGTSAPSDQLAGWAPGVHLSDHGRKQLRLLAARLRGQTIHEVYTSPLERTRETAEPLAAALGCAAFTLAELGELEFGSWSERPFAELDQEQDWQRFNCFRSGSCLPSGKSFLSVQARAVEALLMLRARHADHSLVIVSHADVIKGVVMHFLGVPIDYCHRLSIEPASITRLQLSPDHALITQLNDTAHLDVLKQAATEAGSSMEAQHAFGGDATYEQ